MATNPEHNEGDVENVVEEEDDTGRGIPNTLMQFTNVLSELQSQRIASLMANLPPAVKRRINALKNLQLEETMIESKFFKEVHELECKYHKLYVPLYEKRSTIVNGGYEPDDKEAHWPSDDEEEGSDVADQLKQKAKIGEKENKEENEKMKKEETTAEPVKGIPDFWLTIFKNVSLLAEMVQPHDEPVLKHLTDIKTTCSDNPMSFTLDFHFSPNEYFTNSVLTKYYELKCHPDEDDPFSFEGPEIYKCTGCTINWNKGSNLTLKTVKKKQKHKSRGVIRTVTETVQNDSFFNFFTPPTIPDNAKGEDIDEELRSLLTSDFEIGHYIRERIVPRAVLFFTGEEVEDEDDEYEDDEELDDDEDDDGDLEDQRAAKVTTDQNCKQQ